MICAHLQPLESLLKKQGILETFRGVAWSDNCHEWVYFKCVLDIVRIQKLLKLPPCVIIHENDDPRSGQELGLVCQEHNDGIIGLPHTAQAVELVFP